MVNRYICIHGHFYQPSRENPWLEEVELQDSAYPYHDWNQRITEECYSANVFSLLRDAKKKIIQRVNNYTKISFDFGPTLLCWLKKHAARTYAAILKADKESRKYFSGHGPALALCYNHMIMPLADSRDKMTQVIWGMKDFEYRFKRKPEGMWLPETAVDLETLELFAKAGIKFTILGPHQAKAVKKIGQKQWQKIAGSKINTRIPYLCRLPSGKSLSIFFYDNVISNEVSFGNLLQDGANFAKRLSSAFAENDKSPQIVHIATDGETFGHHHRFGNMALSFCLNKLDENNLIKRTIYSEFLDKFPPLNEVTILENTSWSCSHGIERWRSDCGCNSGKNPGWKQSWRLYLRQAMDWLKRELSRIYEREMSSFVSDPWSLRNDYIEVVLDMTAANIESFLARHIKKELTQDKKADIIKLLEIERQAMLMQTSCGWFFDDISGIEGIQVMLHAARAMQLAREFSKTCLEEKYIAFLKQAKSNNALIRNGAKVYSRFVKPAMFDTGEVKIYG